MKLTPFAILRALTVSSWMSRRIAEKVIFYPVKVANLSDELALEDATFAADDSIRLHA